MKLDIKFNVKINEDLVDDFHKSFLRIAYEAEADAKRLAAVDTGRLRNSIHLVRKSDWWYRLQDGVPYGVHQEFGTYKMTAHPFFRPASAMANTKIIKLFS